MRGEVPVSSVTAGSVTGLDGMDLGLRNVALVRNVVKVRGELSFIYCFYQCVNVCIAIAVGLG